MKVSAIADGDPFQPYEVKIRIESNDEDLAFMQLGNRNIAFPAVLRKESAVTAEVLSAFAKMQHAFVKARLQAHIRN